MSWNAITGPSRHILVTMIAPLAITLIIVGPTAVRASADTVANRDGAATACCGTGENSAPRVRT